jgi:hypothetical protein
MVVSLILKLLSSSINEEMSNKIKYNDNYRSKLSTTIKNNVLDLINNNSQQISKDRYKIVVMKQINNHSEGENDDGLVQEKNGEENGKKPENSEFKKSNEHEYGYENGIT